MIFFSFFLSRKLPLRLPHVIEKLLLRTSKRFSFPLLGNVRERYRKNGKVSPKSVLGGNYLIRYQFLYRVSSQSDVFGRIDGAAKNNDALSQYSTFHQDLAGLDFLTDLFTRMKLGMDQVFNSDILFAITLLNFCKAKKEKKN